jgi:hypothetical protein
MFTFLIQHKILNISETQTTDWKRKNMSINRARFLNFRAQKLRAKKTAQLLETPYTTIFLDYVSLSKTWDFNPG